MGTCKNKIAIFFALTTMLLALSGCSLQAHSVVHDASKAKTASHTIKKVKKAERAGYCAFHAWKAIADVQHGHPGWSAYQVYKSAKVCR
jgi:hypothetical protein